MASVSAGIRAAERGTSTSARGSATAPAAPDVIWSPQPGPQTFLLQSTIKDILLGGARGGGKTYGSIGDWVQHASLYGEYANGLIVRRTLVELKSFQKVARRLFSKLGAKFFGPGSSFNPNSWVFPNGATLVLTYLRDDEEGALNFSGHEYTWIGIEEAGNFESPVAIDMLLGAMRSAHGVPCVMRLTANPGGPGHEWLKERYIDAAPPFTPFICPRTGKQRLYIPSRITDNPKLLESDPDYVTNLRASGPSWLVRAWLLGDWNISIAGNVFQRGWWRYYEPGQEPKTGAIVQSWDTAQKIKQRNDWSVCSTWRVGVDGYYLIDVWRGKVEFPELKKKAVELAERFQCFEILIEDTPGSAALIQELQRDTRLAIVPVLPRGTKYERNIAVSPLIEQGKVLLPKQAPWLTDFIDELSAFPSASHDDQADSAAQAIKHLSTRFVIGGQNYKVEPVDNNRAEAANKKARGFMQATPDEDESDDYPSRTAGLF